MAHSGHNYYNANDQYGYQDLQHHEQQPSTYDSQYLYPSGNAMAGSIDPQTGLPRMSATFFPGQGDDWTMPQPELISPSPQRIMPEVPANIDSAIGMMERTTIGVPNYSQARGGTPVPPVDASQHSNPYTPRSLDDEPSWSPFPKLQNPGPNVPPTDEEKEKYLEASRLPVLSCDDPEVQLAWSQDALNFVEASLLYLNRTTEGGRPPTPAVEYQLRTDATNIVSFLADQHHPRAEFIKGTWLEFGKFGYRIDKKEAFRAYARAAERGYARAEYRMGMQYENSNEPMKAIKHYTQGAALNDSASNYRLGMMTLLGQHGQRQDYQKGISLVSLAAQTADENAPQSAYVFGMMLAKELTSINIPDLYLSVDVVGARNMIEKAAFLGFARAQVKMAQAYELCQLGCDFNPALSLHYNALASRQGEPEADMAISKWFLSGHENVFPKNEELAFKYARQAADVGLPTAEFALGYFYEIGMFIAADLQTAQKWYEKAASHGNKDAIGRLDGISRSNTLSRKDHDRVAVSKIKASRSLRQSSALSRVQEARVSQSYWEVDMPNPVMSDMRKSYLKTPQPHGNGPIRSQSPGIMTGNQVFLPFGAPNVDQPPRKSSITPYPADPAPTRKSNEFQHRPATTAPGGGPDRRKFSLAPDPERRPLSAADGILVPAGTYPINNGRRPSTQTVTVSNQQPVSNIAPMPSNIADSVPYPGFEAPLPVKKKLDPISQIKLKPSTPKPSTPRPSSAQPNQNSAPSLGISKQPTLPISAVSTIKPARTPVPQTTIPSLPSLSENRRPGKTGTTVPAPLSALPPAPASTPATPGLPKVNTITSPSPGPARVSGTGPKTFEEMGVPIQQKEQDCIIM